MTDRPQQIRKDHVFCNFKQPRTPAKRKNSKKRQRRPGMSESHLDCIRKLPCCVSRRMPGGEAHHLKAGTRERGMGMRSTDRWALPLAHEPHMEVERVGTRNELKWFRERGIDAHRLAAALWANTGDVPKMIAVMKAHWSGQ